MVQIIYGKKGTGKSKLMVDTANGLVGVAKGTIVFIDDDNYLIYRLKHQIRFINISEFPIHDTSTFFGFICGLVAVNYDIDSVFIDGFNYFIKDHLNEMTEFFKMIEKFSEKYGLNLYFSINGDTEELTAELKKYEYR